MTGRSGSRAVEGTVTDTEGTPLPGARIEVWQAAEKGFYDAQYDDNIVLALQPESPAAGSSAA